MIKQHKNELTGTMATVREASNGEVTVAYKDIDSNTVLSVRFYNNFKEAQDAALKYLDLKV
jgi:hypothetical protein